MLFTLKKITNGVLALLIVVSSVGFIPTVHAGGSPTIEIGSQSGSNGATINVPVNASNFANAVAGMDFSVQYDSSLLTYTGLTQNAISGHGTLTTNNNANPIPINWFDSTALDIANGPILTLNFTVISDATTNASLTIVGTKEISNAAGDVISSSSSFVGGIISLNPDTTAPAITLLGDAIVNLLVGDAYVDAGATASDNVDGDITANIVTMGLPINTATPGAYTITYNVSDAGGNAATEVTRTVNIVFGRVSHRKGTADASISLDVYTDYQCPFCVQFQSTLNQALEEYQGEVNYYINHFPLSVMHPNAWKAAEATECANDQGDVYFWSFWRMHDWLVSMATDFTIDDIRNFAVTLIDFNSQQFNSCLDSGSKQQVIQEHINSGGDILGVPTTYVRRNSDGQFEKVEGAVSFEALKQVIDSLLPQPVPELPEPGQPVPDTIPPVVTLSGDATVNLTVGDTYTDAGATASDDVDGDITANIVTVNSVNTAIAGTYTVTYNVSDAAGNAAVAITRTVIVAEVVAPPAPVALPRGGGGGSSFVALSSPAPVDGTALQTFPVAAPAPIVPTVIARTVTPQVLGVRVFSENILLRVEERSIYIARGRRLHSIPNAEVLRRFANRDRLEVTAEDIAGYEIGSPIPAIQPSYVARTLLRVNSRDIYVVDVRTLNRVPNPAALWPYRDFTRLEVGDDALIEFTIGKTVPVL